MIGPIKPRDVQNQRDAAIPEAVFKAFNELIASSWDGYSARVQQKQVAEKIAENLGISKSDVFDRHLLNVEESYRKAGWDVDYDKPAYNETYGATFTFKKK